MVQFSAILPSFLDHTITYGPRGLRLIQHLGSGAYGAVWLAHDLAPPDGFPVYFAVKCLLRHPKDSEQDVLQKREIAYHQLASQHPHVVKLHAVVEEEHYVFLIMDYCPGGDLFSAIIDRGTFAHNDARIRNIFVQLLDAVHACHDDNLFHRDLKPENVLCSKDDSEIFLSDFGLSTRTKFSANYGCGSSFYMSPECIGVYSEKGPYSASRSDIWALGVILVNIVTGRSPWHIASPHIDIGFRTFLRDGPAYLRRMLPISYGLSEVLGVVFEPRPARRMTINQLRAAVLAMPTFFDDVPEYIRLADESHGDALRQSGVDIMNYLPSNPFFSEDPSEAPISQPPCASHASIECNASMFVNGSRVPTQGGVSVSFPGIVSDSDSDSTEPATPETTASESSTTVPDMVLDHTEGPRNVHAGHVASKASPNKLTWSFHRVVGAVHRIRVRA